MGWSGALRITSQGVGVGSPSYGGDGYFELRGVRTGVE